MKTAKLLLHCPDKPGILAEVTDFITVNKGNIIYLDQYVDHVENIFFMRIEWELKDFLVPQEKIEDYFRTWKGVDMTLAVDNLFNYVPFRYYNNSPATKGTTFSAGLSLDIEQLFK